jgi:hypothetical protein
MFEYEKYVHDAHDKVLLDAYLSRVLLRIEALKAYYDIK